MSLYVNEGKVAPCCSRTTVLCQYADGLLTIFSALNV